MTLKEKKRRLSEILGINIFDPKYKGIDAVLGTDEDKPQEPDPSNEENTEGKDPETSESTETSETSDTDDTVDTDTSTEDKGSESSEEADDSQAETGDETDSDNADSQESTEKPSDEHIASDDELFDAKLEAKLLRAGVREDRIDAAKKLFKADFTLADIEKVEQFLKEYPEWKNQKAKEPAKKFGMDVGDRESGESAEERRLRELGIA